MLCTNVQFLQNLFYFTIKVLLLLYRDCLKMCCQDLYYICCNIASCLEGPEFRSQFKTGVQELFKTLGALKIVGTRMVT
jgi:hypothetical protein